MENISTIYIKQPGEAPVPVTVRIDWLSDGTIRPSYYWLPDGTKCKVIMQSKGVSIDLLKEGGEGLRFRVTSEIIDTYEPYSEILNTQHTTYLYLSHKRFHERNIIDGRYGHAGKEYIPVTIDVFPNGEYELVYFLVSGKRYMVERTLAVEPRGSFNAGGIGLWHKVDARLVNAYNDEDPDRYRSVRRPAALYLELNKWFVSVANTA